MTSFRASDFLDRDILRSANGKIVIAIDGPAASGKGTLARNIAHRLNFAHLDTGMLYRGLGAAVIKGGGDPENSEDVQKILEDFVTTLNAAALQDPELRSDAVGSAASKVAALPAVRQALLEYQRNFGNMQTDDINGVVLDGRDIGTVVCPDADIKVFVTADRDIRADRRYRELKDKGVDITFETVLADLKKRDDRDAGRKVAPMKAAADAFVLDTTQLNTAEALAQVIDVIRGQLLEKYG